MSAVLEYDGLGELSVMDGSGDTKLIWDKNKPDEVAAARRMFNDLKKKNYLAYSVTKKGKQKDIIKDFDEKLERIIMVPPVVGG